MLPSLLPRSAAAYAPRTKPTVVLPTRTESWLKETLKRVTHRSQRGPLNSAPQQQECLETLLAGERAIWSLATITIPTAPESQMTRADHPIGEALANNRMLHIDAYVVHIDMVAQHEVAYKLTRETIQSLIEYYTDIYLVDEIARTCGWPEKDEQVRRLKEEFVLAVNSFVFRTAENALEGMMEEGAGEMLEGRSEKVKEGIWALFKPLLPPPPPPSPLSMTLQQQRFDELAGTAPYGYNVTPYHNQQQQWWPPSTPAAQYPSEPWPHQQYAFNSSPMPVSPDSNVWSPTTQHESYAPSPASSHGQSFTPAQYCSPFAGNVSILPPSTGSMVPAQPQCAGLGVIPEHSTSTAWMAGAEVMPQYVVPI